MLSVCQSSYYDLLNIIDVFAVEIPANYMMKVLAPSIWIPSIMVGWGIVCICMGLVKNFEGLTIARAFLGLTEGGLFPGISFL